MLTLPPVVGRKYLYQNADSDELRECTIQYEDEHKGETVYKAEGEHDNWTFWPDGEAKVNKHPPVAVLIEDVPPDVIKEIRNKRDAMMQRLKQLSEKKGGAEA